jgi:hypothetical protein
MHPIKRQGLKIEATDYLRRRQPLEVRILEYRVSGRGCALPKARRVNGQRPCKEVLVLPAHTLLRFQGAFLVTRF